MMKNLGDGMAREEAPKAVLAAEEAEAGGDSKAYLVTHLIGNL
jgi:hypothetical protein